MRRRELLRAALATALAVLPPAGAGAVVGGGKTASQAEGHRPGAVLVAFRAGATPRERSEAHRRAGAAGARAIGRSRVERVALPPGRSVEEAVATYARLPGVESAGPDRVVAVQATPDDPWFTALWGLDRISAPAAWDITTGSAGVVVAVVDTGIDAAHPDLAGNLWVNEAEAAGVPGLDDDFNGYVDDVHGINAITGTGDPADDHGHGTHVAGTIGAVGNNAVGVVGVAWAVRVMACKFIGAGGSGYVSDAMECLEYARAMRERGVRVVATNNSWGVAATIPELAAVVRDQGDILFVAAAANDAADIDRTDYAPAGIRLPNVISVAATRYDDGLARFSNTGLTGVHLGAPGEGIESTMSSVNVFGAAAYHALSGTSMAAPHVSGVAALVAAADPGRDWRAVRARVLTGGVPLAALAGRTATGRRVDALGALTCGGAPLFAVTEYPKLAPQYTVGVPATLSAVSLECETPRGPVTATTDLGQIVELRDDGVVPDAAAGDGTFTASWTPTRAGERLTFASPLGSQTLVAPLIGVAGEFAADAAVGRPYSFELAATGGLPPYAWEIAAGALPAGLAIDPATGVISGVPEAFGRFDLPVTVRDQFGASFSRTVVLFSVLWNTVSREWAATSGAGGTAWNELFGIAVDAGGGAVTAGDVQFFAGGYAGRVAGLDPAGAERWAVDLPGGEAGYISGGVALDPAGRAVVAGTSGVSGPAGLVVAKFDLDGAPLWSAEYPGVVAWGRPAVAVDGSGAVYVATAEEGAAGARRCLVLKFGADGGLLWERRRARGMDCYLAGIAPAPDGSVVVTGFERGQDAVERVLTARYSAANDELWVRVQGHGAVPGLSFGASVACDDAGNAYVGAVGYAFDGGAGKSQVLKYGPGGDLLWVRGFRAVHLVPGMEPRPLLAAGADGLVRAAFSAWVGSPAGQRYNGTQAFLALYDRHGNYHGTSVHGDTAENDQVNAFGLVGGGGGLAAGQRCISGQGCFFDVVRYRDGPRVAPIDLDAPEAGVPYRRELAALGGTPPLTWSVLGGELPAGVALDPATGVLEGVPAVAGVSDVIVAATDATGAVAPLAASIRVGSALRVATASLAEARAYADYDQPLAAEGGVAPLVWTLAAGELPPGIFLDPVGGRISGATDAKGSFPLVFTVVDARGAAATREFALVVNPGLAIGTAMVEWGVVGVPYAFTLEPLGGEPPHLWSVTGGALPRGLVLHAATGRISGTPRALAWKQVQFTVRDASGLEASAWFDIAVDALSRYWVHTASRGGAGEYDRMVFAPLGRSSGDSAAGDVVRARFKGRRPLLVGYRARPYARKVGVMTLSDSPGDTSITFLAEDSPGTGFVTLVVVDPKLRRVVRALGTVAVPLAKGVPKTVRDIAGLWGVVPAGRSIGVRLSISTPRLSANSVRWGRTGGGRRFEQWFTAWEWLW